MAPKDTCQGCGRPCVGRFCRRCVGELLSQPVELPKPTYGGSDYTYPLRRKPKKPR